MSNGFVVTPLLKRKENIVCNNNYFVTKVNNDANLSEADRIHRVRRAADLSITFNARRQ